MKRPAAVVLLALGAVVGSGLVGGCGRADEPTQFTPPSAETSTHPAAGEDRGPPAERRPARRIEMH